MRVELTVGNWIAIIALVVSFASASVSIANFVSGRRDRQRSAAKNRPSIQAHINADNHEGGWRSVSLHVAPPEEREQNFPYQFWRIERVTLIRPKNAKLARAADDDYHSGVFFPEAPMRELESARTGSQRFALEFFIKFEGDEKGQVATFKVVYSHVKTGERYTASASTSVAGMEG